KEAVYRACDGFVLPSLSEGLPMVVLEAWAYRKPVLMSPACNLAEGFDAGAAMSIDPDPAQIARGLEAFLSLSDGELDAMGANGRRLVERQYAWPKIAASMVSVYNWAAGGAPRPECVLA